MHSFINDKNYRPTESLVDVYIKSTLKNTLVTLKKNNSLITQVSSKSFPKIKNQKANNFYTLKELSKKLINIIKQKRGIQLRVYVKGTGMGKNIIIRTLSYKFLITGINDLTPIPFNGCRPKRQKRR